MQSRHSNKCLNVWCELGVVTFFRARIPAKPGLAGISDTLAVRFTEAASGRSSAEKPSDVPTGASSQQCAALRLPHLAIASGLKSVLWPHHGQKSRESRGSLDNGYAWKPR